MSSRQYSGDVDLADTQGRNKLDNWGGGGADIHIYVFPHHIKTIDFKRN